MSEKNSKNENLFANKWGNSALAMGWTGIPTSLFFLQGTLSISPLAFNILLNLIAHWWKTHEWPHPSQDGLAKRVGVSTRTIQRGISELETLGLIMRQRTSKDHPKYKGRNLYDLSPLINTLNKLTPDINEKLNEKQPELDNSKPFNQRVITSKN